MSYLTIQYGSGIIYKKIEILETDITYNDLKYRIFDSKIKDGRCIKSKKIKIKIEEEYELFHNNEIIDMDEEIDFNKNPLNIAFTTKYYKNYIIFINPLKDIENKTLENCKHEFDKDWKIIVFEENQTYELCKYAIDKSPYGCALGYIKNQTDELCKYAIDKDYEALGYVKKHNDELCKYAIDKYYNEEYAKKTTELAIYVINFVKNQTDELCKYAIDKHFSELCYVRNQTDELCRYAIDKDYEAIYYVDNNNKNYELCRYAIDKDYRALQFIDNPTKKICYYAINKSNGNALQYIKNKTYRICKCAINTNIEAIKFVNIEITQIDRIKNNKLERLKRKNIKFEKLI